MKKPHALRAALVEALDARHGLRTDPYRLQMAATKLGLFASARPGQAAIVDMWDSSVGLM